MQVLHNDVMKAHHMDEFATLWQLETPWFEPPNVRRGGWSGVVKYVLPTNTGQTPVFIKRQENHISKTWNHLIKGIPTFQKEYRNILRLSKHNIPNLDLVYFGVEKSRAILITKALDGFDSLESIDPETLEPASKSALINQLAIVIRQMHQYHLQHNCLYPKHIFVRQMNGKWDIRLIDLEKMKRTLFKRQAVLRDLSTLYRHSSPAWTSRDLVRFFRAYRDESRLSLSSKKLWHFFADKLAGKRR